MVDVKLAIDYVLKQEDSRLTGAVTTLAGDNGGATRFGIASAYHPELVAQGFYDPQRVGRDSALAMAERVYNVSYAAPLALAGFNDQAIATALLSFGVNAGVSRAGELLQAACVACGKPVVVDHKIGPGTLRAANSIDPGALLDEFSAGARRFYTTLAETHPQDARDLAGWLNRVTAWTTA